MTLTPLLNSAQKDHHLSLVTLVSDTLRATRLLQTNLRQEHPSEVI